LCMPLGLLTRKQIRKEGRCNELGTTGYQDVQLPYLDFQSVLLTAVNALVRLIGAEKIENLGKAAARPGIQWYPVRYIVLPFVSVFVLTNPMAYTMGRFLPERFKPAFYDSAVSFVHPILGIFPHANPGELFVYVGIATGIQQLGYGLGDLAVRYMLVGLVVIFIRGIVTEAITARMMKKGA